MEQIKGRSKFLRKDAVEIKFDDEKFIVVPQAAVLVLVRDIA